MLLRVQVRSVYARFRDIDTLSFLGFHFPSGVLPTIDGSAMFPGSGPRWNTLTRRTVQWSALAQPTHPASRRLMLPEKRRRESRLSMEGRTFGDNASVALLAVSYEVCDVK